MTDLNMTSILAGSLIGVQRRGLQKFFGAMGILPPVQIESYKRYEDLLFTSIQEVAEKSTEVAANEARAYYKGDDVTVSIDGTWLTQGYSSLHGVGTIVSVADPPKVLDYEILSRHCSECAGLLAIKKSDGELYSKLLEEHLKCGCEANYEGSSGGMEGAAMVKMFGRSILKHNLRYTTYIADGDTKNDISISQSKPYDDLAIERKQCVNHFSKRMKTRLLNIKKSYGRKRLADNKTIGGKDDGKIYKLQIYFGKAIRDNNNDLEKMKQAAWAAWFHMSSTDENPMHDLCNPDHCKLYLDFNYKHQSHSLPPAVCAAIKPAYDDLCSDECLRQALNGGTTNPNESFHRIIWSLCIIYNEGFIGLIPIYKSFGIAINNALLKMLKKIDHERIKEDQSFDPLLRLEQRRRNRFERLQKEVKLTQADPHKYGAGIAD
ncbi:unnamed protein product [Rotaria sordida]|uniref:Mutator-like transposase domain-containing protein n=1 Tax=Rotaria sordida TaxID=392033 RepID=A0A814PEY8_9BILA|nr:unnamed protein product [Rotaria sordida]CAF1132518.1 unnamed protein product [Rotaria sordida]CAF1139184.1 unnamed protein product [Rotaria sordida]CAF3677985.1 unnamed protein product [Rotaria sordida]CAF3916408.1 unnamed protein product [Rotaria sordida]